MACSGLPLAATELNRKVYMAEATIDTGKIHDWPSFHAQSAEAFGFPDFYGRNLNAWVDCLSYLSEGDGMTRFALGPDEQLFIKLLGAESFTKSQPEIWQAFSESVALVNQRYISAGAMPRLVLVPQ
jgi:Barstar (barnase inhibitor)